MKSCFRKKKTFHTLRYELFLVLVISLFHCQNQKASADMPQSPVISSAAKLSPSTSPSAITINDLKKEVLAPRLLKDQKEMAQYLAAFPAEIYWIFEVPQVGKFYIEDQKDIIKDLIRSGKPQLPPDDPLTKAFVRPGTTVIDIGAHIGTTSLVYSRLVGPNGRVYAFEPQKKIFRELVYNLKLNQILNVVPLRYAVGDNSGIIEMNRADSGNEGATKVGHGGDKAELRTLDSFGFKNVSVVKIDVEHYEDYVLSGMKKTIAENYPVIFIEIQGGARYEFTSDRVRKKIRKTILKLEGLGYSVYHIGTHDYLAFPRPRSLTNWDVSFFNFTMAAEPRKHPDKWRTLASSPEAVQVKLRDLAINYGRKGPEMLIPADKLGNIEFKNDLFGMIAKAKVHLTKGTWTLGTLSDDGVQVRLNGKIVIDNWTLHIPAVNSRTFTLLKDETVEISVEHFDGVGPAALCVWLIPIQ